MKTTTLVFLFLAMSLCTFSQKYHNQKIVGYVPNYSNGTTIDYTNLTHSAFCFLIVNPNGTIKPWDFYETSNFNTYLQRTEGSGTKRVITLGNEVGEVAKYPDSLHTMADTLVKFCQKYQFTAVDIDWELLSTAEERDRYDDLMDTLSTKLHKNGIELIATIGFGDYWCQWFSNEALHKADWIQVMAYGLLGSWSTSPFGNHSTFQNMVDAGKYWEDRGFDKDKMVLGLPFFGMQFKSASGGLATPWTYRDIVNEFPNLADSDNVTPGTDYNFFNGPALIRQKCQYLIDNGYGGVMVWEMTQDAVGDKSLQGQITCTYTDTECKVKTTAIENQTNSDLKIATIDNFIVLTGNQNGEASVAFYDLTGRIIESRSIIINSTTTYLPKPIVESSSLLLFKIELNNQVYSYKLLR